MTFKPCCHLPKYNGAGVRYEVSICFETGWIVWFNGPFRPGVYSDLKLAQDCGLHAVLNPDERHIADGTNQCNEAIRPSR